MQVECKQCWYRHPFLLTQLFHRRQLNLKVCSVYEEEAPRLEGLYPAMEFYK